MCGKQVKPSHFSCWRYLSFRVKVLTNSQCFSIPIGHGCVKLQTERKMRQKLPGGFGKRAPFVELPEKKKNVVRGGVSWFFFFFKWVWGEGTKKKKKKKSRAFC